MGKKRNDDDSMRENGDGRELDPEVYRQEMKRLALGVRDCEADVDRLKEDLKGAKNALKEARDKLTGAALGEREKTLFDNEKPGVDDVDGPHVTEREWTREPVGAGGPRSSRFGRMSAENSDL